MTYIHCVYFVQIHVYEIALFYVQHYTSIFLSLGALTGSCEYFSKPRDCFDCLCVSIGCLGVWRELVNHKRSLTHRPSSQGWAPRHPTHFVIACLYTYRFVVVTLGLGSLLSSQLLAM